MFPYPDFVFVSLLFSEKDFVPYMSVSDRNPSPRDDNSHDLQPTPGRPMIHPREQLSPKSNNKRVIP